MIEWGMLRMGLAVVSLLGRMHTYIYHCVYRGIYSGMGVLEYWASCIGLDFSAFLGISWTNCITFIVG